MFQMKKTFPSLFFGLLALTLHGQITFPVCTVDKATEPLDVDLYRDVVNYLALRDQQNRDLFAVATADSAAAVTADPRLEACGAAAYPLVSAHGIHPLVMALYQSYAEHRPIVLSPDMIWLMIAQGFTAHVDANAEELRRHFVRHEGRQVLCVRRDDYIRGDSTFPWPEVFDSFHDQIAIYADPKVAQLVTAPFSTTSPAERAALDVALMDGMSSYFLYAMSVLCGIPEITLEGTPADWAALEERTAALGVYDLTWWTDRLQPILHQFTLAAQGQADPAFWKDMFQEEIFPDGCTSLRFLTGWVLQFFPYLDGRRNPWVTTPEAIPTYLAALEKAQTLRGEEEKKAPRLLNVKKAIKQTRKQKEQLSNEEWEAQQKERYPRPEDYGLRTIELSDLPMGLSQADLVLDYHGQLLQYTFRAGFVGIRQDPETLALRPEINWMVIDAGKTPTTEDAELYRQWRDQTAAGNGQRH